MVVLYDNLAVGKGFLATTYFLKDGDDMHDIHIFTIYMAYIYTRSLPINSQKFSLLSYWSSIKDPIFVFFGPKKSQGHQIELLMVTCGQIKLV